MNSTPHTSYFLVSSHLMIRTPVAQVSCLACAHHIPCVILMRSYCVFDSLRLLHVPFFAVYVLSYHPVFPPGHQLHLPRCGGQIPCASSANEDLGTLAENEPLTETSSLLVPHASVVRKCRPNAEPGEHVFMRIRDRHNTHRESLSRNV